MPNISNYIKEEKKICLKKVLMSYEKKDTAQYLIEQHVSIGFWWSYHIINFQDKKMYRLLTRYCGYISRATLPCRNNI